MNDPEIRGVDELTSCGINQVFGIGKLAMPEIENWTPEKWNTTVGTFSQLSGGDLDENLKIMNSLWKEVPPTLFEIVCL